MKSLFAVSTVLVLFPGLAWGSRSRAESGSSSAKTDPQLTAIENDPPPVLRRATDLGPADRAQVLSISVNLRFARPHDMQEFVDSVSNPKSSNYRHFIAPEEVGERFGIPAERVDRVVDHLRRNGFTINLVSKNRLAVLASGTVEQAENAFHTAIHEYSIAPENKVEPARFHSYNSTLELPADLAPDVLYVGGLETYTRPEHRVTTLDPSQARTLYHAASLFNGGKTGAGRTIGVSSFDGFRSADWLSYISHFNLPVPQGGAGTNITVVPCNGGGMGAGAANAEGDLDIQMELGMAPLANIRIYDSPPGSDLLSVLSTEGNDNAADVISESYGWLFFQSSGATAAHNAHLAISALGITYMAASGDSGTTLEPYSYPDFEPEVLSIGGTTVQADSAGNRIAETGWSNGGGGWSNNTAAFNVRPVWQTGNGVPAVTPLNNYRLVPDISFHAAGNDGGAGAYYFYTGGALHSDYIGTSFSSPVFAGLLGIVEQDVIALGGLPPNGLGKRRFGRIQDYLYGQNGRADIWYDVTVGNNGVLLDGGMSDATVGWDTATGWGPMDCAAFAPVAACDTGGSCGEGVPFCGGDGVDPNVTTGCPCGNFGATGHGCANSANPSGAILSASGTAGPDTIVMTCAGERSTSFSILIQGTTNASAGILFGDGVRCVNGALKRLFIKNAVAGVFTAPENGDPSITSRSAALGDPIPSGGVRYYQVWYRDPDPIFCPSATSNVSNGWTITWP